MMQIIIYQYGGGWKWKINGLGGTSTGSLYNFPTPEEAFEQAILALDKAIEDDK